MAKGKRLVGLADFHSGHRVGLTPPDYQNIAANHPGHIWQKFAKIQKECWDFFSAEIEKLKPIDVLVLNGDAIDGRGEKSGGTELITGDRNEQIKIALKCVEFCEPAKLIIIRGTPYHTGEAECWEDVMYEYFTRQKVECKVGDHDWLDINGVIFDFKHYISGSQVPYGRNTALNRDEIWNSIWAEAGDQPRGDWIIRAHVHYFAVSGRYVGPKLKWAVILPALQAMGTRFGARQMSGTVDYGFCLWDISKKGNVKWRPLKGDIQSQKAAPLII